MDKHQLAENLAASLSCGAWTPEALERTLSRRLPPAMQGISGKLSGSLVQEIPKSYAPAPALIKVALLRSPSFKRLLAYCQKHNTWPNPDLTSGVMAPAPPFEGSSIPHLTTLEALADWAGLSLDQLSYLADVQNRFEDHGDTAVNHYHYHLKEKSSGGLRVIEAPKTHLKSVQRFVLKDILNHVTPHPDSFGFVRGRSCLDGAGRHAGERVVVRFDLKDFFPSIGYSRIFGLFRCLGYPHKVAQYLSALCTNVTPARVLEKLPSAEQAIFRIPHLPQGAPSSPSLANHLAFKLDTRLSALARSLNANFSRYADDLTFSGDPFIARSLLRIVPDIVAEEGFVLNSRKTKVRQTSSRQTVTGLVVNKHLNIDRKTYDRLKATIHACAKPNDTRFYDQAFCATLIGKLDWCERVNPQRGRKLKALLAQAFEQKAENGKQ